MFFLKKEKHGKKDVENQGSKRGEKDSRKKLFPPTTEKNPTAPRVHGQV